MGTETRLLNCFSAVFPDAGEDELRSAAMGATESWDSMASVTLVSLVEEEFGVQVAPDDLEHFVSFRQVLGYVEGAAEKSAL